MLFAVRMDVSLPPGLDPAERGDILAREKAYSQELHAHLSAVDAVTSHARESNGARPPLPSGHGAAL